LIAKTVPLTERPCQLVVDLARSSHSVLRKAVLV